MTPRLAGSYAYCERMARREAGNFYHAFRVLPAPQRRAMWAAYAFCRATDDIVDRAENRATDYLCQKLDDWGVTLARAHTAAVPPPRTRRAAARWRRYQLTQARTKSPNAHGSSESPMWT